MVTSSGLRPLEEAPVAHKGVDEVVVTGEPRARRPERWFASVRGASGLDTPALPTNVERFSDLVR